MIAISTINVTLCFDMKLRECIRRILEAVQDLCEAARRAFESYTRYAEQQGVARSG